MRNLLPILACTAAVILVALPRPADACSPIGNLTHSLDPAHANDVTPPSPVVIRSHYARVLNGGTCNPIGYLVLAVAATDDATHPDRIGYRVQVTAGDAVRSPNEDLVATDSSLYLYFDPRSPGFVIDLEVSAVDQNGNVGPATAYHVDFTNPNPVTDEPEPTDDGGCATSGGAGWLAALAVALLVLRRRRR